MEHFINGLKDGFTLNFGSEFLYLMGEVIGLFLLWMIFTMIVLFFWIIGKRKG